MKKIADLLFSTRMMAIVLALFALSIALATFIENDFGSASARALVYNARWFEFLLLLGLVNLVGTIIRKQMYRKSKLTVFTFHLSFLLIILGAAITRFTGFEGTLTLREGETDGRVLTDAAYIEINADNNRFLFPAYFSALGKKKFSDHFRFGGKTYELTCRSFIVNAVPDLLPDPEGRPMADIVYTDSTGRRSLILAQGEKKTAGAVTFSFDSTDTDPRAVRVYVQGDSLMFEAPFPVARTSMADQSRLMLQENKPVRFMPMQLYSFKSTMVVMSKYFTRAKISAKQVASEEGQTLDALDMVLSTDDAMKEFTVWGKAGNYGRPETINFDNHKFVFNYGSIYKQLPFELKLNDFIVERYPGSNSPSWFESRVELNDNIRSVSEPRRIYMNNILKYRGYRFYQSSYLPDESGTILSVNRDWAGTLITYLGYLMMGLGMALSLLNRNSRFRSLSAENALLRTAKRGLPLIFMIFSSFQAEAQDSIALHGMHRVDPDHARLFGKLLVQDNDGRIEPINTMSSDVLRKLSRRTEFRGFTPEQVIIGMMTDPEHWQNEPLIRATHPQIQTILGKKEKYFSFVSFFPDNNYILREFVDNAYRKKPAMRSKFDNEIIRLDERINICYMVFTGDLFRILPNPNDSTHTWHSYRTIHGHVASGDSVFLDNVIPLYIQYVNESYHSGNWKNPNDIIQALAAYQSKVNAALVPSDRKISLEVFLNKSSVFPRISRIYGLVGFVMLILQFISLFYTKIKVRVPVIISMIVIIIAFIFHTFGLGLRWYVSGHAPWSNGYEALTYIAWATVLAGMIFSSRSAITLSATAIMAFLILHTAHLSWMDPQITNLVPVLKSYWLVIHVAIITASYAFLALGALLASVNLILMILISRRKFQYIDLTIRELSNIMEMALIVGLYMLTIGTFLGGVWANESWGRYWGWDPKETWALVTVLIYAFISHMRMVPGLRGIFGFNLAGLVGFSSVIMTYFGVNYYLSGLHSYAKGDPLPVPVFVYYTLAVVFVVSISAYINYGKLNREMTNLNP